MKKTNPLFIQHDVYSINFKMYRTDRSLRGGHFEAFPNQFRHRISSLKVSGNQNLESKLDHHGVGFRICRTIQDFSK